MFSLKRRYVVVYLTLFFMYAFGEIDEDYFFGAALLRSEYKDDCGNDIQKLQCRLNCPKYHICLKNKCLCFQIVSNDERTVNGGKQKIEFPKMLYTRTSSKELNPPGFIDLTKVHDEESKPVLRHHIAHFCPNLDEARVCIRKCMEVGKPAFCGKDHVCYCGHRYNPNVQDKGSDAKAMYAQFKDLYQKYFGDSYVAQHFR